MKKLILIAAVMFAALHAEVWAENAAADCVNQIKVLRDEAVANGHPLSRKDQKALLFNCRSVELQERLSAANAELIELDLQIDELGQIRDEKGQVLARLEDVHGQLIIIDDVEARTDARVRRVEAILAQIK